MKKTILLSIVTLFTFISCKKEISNSSIGNRDEPENSTQQVNEDTGYVKDVFIPLGDGSIKFIEKYKPGKLPVVFINLHENEVTSYRAADSIFERFGGKVIQLTQHGDRNVKFKLNNATYIFDPNRVFTENGIKKTLQNLSKYQTNAFESLNYFSEEMIKSFDINKDHIVIALHNNTLGSYSIKSYLPKGSESINTEKIHVNPKHSEDDFYVVTDEKVFESLKNLNYNVVMQNNHKPIDDGSLSVYAGNNGINYINVEALHGNLDGQIEMIETLLQELLILYNLN